MFLKDSVHYSIVSAILIYGLIQTASGENDEVVIILLKGEALKLNVLIYGRIVGHIDQLFLWDSAAVGRNGRTIIPELQTVVKGVTPKPKRMVSQVYLIASHLAGEMHES